MFKYFPIFYYPEGEGYGGEAGGGQEESSEESSEKSSSNSGESSGENSGGGAIGTAVNYSSDTKIQSDTPDIKGDVVQGDGEINLRVTPYAGRPSQHRRGQMFGAPPPPGLSKHIQIHAGPYVPSGSLSAAFIRIQVNAYVTAEDSTTGALTIDPAFDEVVDISDVTPSNSPGAPYFTTTSNNYEIEPYNLGSVAILSFQPGDELADPTFTGSKQLYLEYENLGTALPFCPFKRKIRVTWAGGDSREFEVILPGTAHLDLSHGSASHPSYTNSVRADGCSGDGTSGHVHTSVSDISIGYTGNNHDDYIYAGFFKTINGNNATMPTGYAENTVWNNFKYYDWAFDSNDGPFNFGTVGNQEQNFSGEQYYKGLITNIDGNNNVTPGTGNVVNASDYFNNNVSGNAYDWLEGNLLQQSMLIGFGMPYIFDAANTGVGFRFADVHVYSEDTPDCTTAPPPGPTFTVCTDQGSTDHWLLTGVDCSGTNLITPINYVANPSLGTFVTQNHPNTCCTDCNGLSLQATVVDVTTQGGSDGIIEVTVLDGGFSGSTPITGQTYSVGGIGTATGNETGNGRYAWTIQALNATSIGGLGTGSMSSPVVLGYGYATHPLGGQDYVNTFTFGFQEDLAQDAVTTTQSSAFAGLTALQVTANSVTSTLIPPSTNNGTFTTGLIAGCYRIFVRDESVNGANSTVPCYAFIDVCVQDGVGQAGCTDNNVNTNDGAALNYNSNAVVDDGSCLYCNANNGTLIDSSSQLAPTAGEIALSGINSFIATPTIRTNSNDGVVNTAFINPTVLFQPFINDVVDANGMANADYTLQFYNTGSKVDWDAAQSSASPNDLTNFSTVGGLIDNNNLGWSGNWNTATIGANINYGYYAVKIAISDPDATVEVEQCYQVFYFVIPINVCVHPSGLYATAITNTNVPPGTLIIPVAEDILWWSNPTMCSILNNHCCIPPTLTNPSGQCQTNQLEADFNCDPQPTLLTFELQYDNGGSWVTINTNTHVPSGPTAQFYTFTYTQGATVTSTNFVDDGFYRVVLVSSYTNSADCTQTSAVIQVVSDPFGCTDPTALNFDPLASCNQGCIYCVYGCTDPIAINYNPLATCDDGSCITPILGCTDPNALNYNPNANTNNGSCIYGTYGCTDPTAYNYNVNCAGITVVATVDDGCCFYPCSPGNQGKPSSFSTTDATGTCGASNADGTVTVGIAFPGSNIMAGQTKTIEYFTNAGVSVYIDPTTYSSAANSTFTQLVSGVYYFVITDNWGCTETQTFSIGSTIVTCGCTDPNAANYDPAATLDDGSCIYGGCIDPNALNFNPNAAFDDGSCKYPVVVSPCIPANTSSLINLLEACIAKNGFQYYNKLVTGQADDCSIMNAWKVILIEYLVSKRGTKCIYNCADSSTANASSLTTCSSKWIIGGPKTGSNDQAFAGSIINPGQGTTIIDPSLYFVAGNTLYLGDVIKMPSGNIYEVVPPATSFTGAGANPETSQGAQSGYWQQCVSGLQISSFPNSVNYLDKFNTFVAKFCVDCNIVDENVIKNTRSFPASNRGRTGGLSIDGINGLEI